MDLETYRKHLKDMSEEEITQFIQDNRRNRETVSETVIKAVRKKTEKTNAKAMIKGLTDEEKEFLRSLNVSTTEEGGS